MALPANIQSIDNALHNRHLFSPNQLRVYRKLRAKLNRQWKEIQEKQKRDPQMHLKFFQ